MRKIILLITFTILVGLTANCSGPVPTNGFRIKSRTKFRIFGIPLPFSVSLPFVQLNLKTTTMPGTAGTTGMKTEYEPGGGFINTGLNAKFDAVGNGDPVLPAPWTVKAAPNQAQCGNSSTTTFMAQAGKSYKFKCFANISIDFLVKPTVVDLTEQGSTPPNQLEGLSSQENKLFQSAQNLTVKYYKQIGSTEDYELVDEQPVLGVLNGGTSFTFNMPNTSQTEGYAKYRVLVMENGVSNVYLAHGEFEILYPLIVDPPDPQNQ